MLSFPNCKINLGLRILRRRDDGYHELDTAFYPLPVKDVLEMIRNEELAFTAPVCQPRENLPLISVFGLIIS